MVYRVGRRLRRALFLEAAAPGGVEAARRAHLSAGYADEARRRAEAGDYTEAIRCLFLGIGKGVLVRRASVAAISVEVVFSATVNGIGERRHI